VMSITAKDVHNPLGVNNSRMTVSGRWFVTLNE